MAIVRGAHRMGRGRRLSARMNVPEGKAARRLGALFLVLTVAFCSWVRIRTTLADPNFLADRPDGLMRSDPGLIFYMVERVIDGGGLPPADFRADPRVGYPGRTDLAALDAVSQEFPIAWAYLLFGNGVSLHLFCLYVMSVFASLAAAGVYFVALELTGKIRWGCFAVAMYAAMPANYRTTGFLLMREDVSVPFLALHLALLARAARVRTPASMVLCGLSLWAAAASWHAMTLFLGLEALCFFLWYLRTGENPLDVPFAWLVPVVAGVLSLGVPLLRETRFAVSLPMLLAAGLAAAAALKRRGASRLPAAAAAVGTATVGTAAAIALARLVAGGAGSGGYSHVWDLMAAKVRFLGELPADPGVIPFDARMMWQGPFATFPVRLWPAYFGVPLLAAVPAGAAAIGGWIRGRETAAHWSVFALATVGLAGAWLVGRVMVLPGLLLPVCAVLFASRIPRTFAAAALAGAVLLVQGYLFYGFMGQYRILWYQPPALTHEYRALLAALPGLVPQGEAITADPVVSTAILSKTGHPIVLQPKLEDPVSRDRFREVTLAFFRQSPEALRRLLVDRYRCRYLLVDRWTLWVEMRYMAGIPPNQPAPDPGTAASAFLDIDAGGPSPVPGYRLLYRSPPEIAARFGNPKNQILLFELAG